MNPDVSIVVPTKNRRDKLEHVLPTLVRQTCDHSRYEVLLCDHDSTDGTRELVEALNAPNLRFVPVGEPGRSAGRNAGIRVARGRIVLFSDADILADPRLVEEHIEAHRRHDPAAVVGWEVMVDSLDEYRDCAAHPERRRRLHPAWKKRISWLFFITGNASVPRQHLERAGLFDESFTGYGHEDLELGYRIQQLGLPILHWPAAVDFHWHPHTFEERAAKMHLSGVSTVRFYRKHRDWRILARMGVNPFTLGLHALMPEDGMIIRALSARVNDSALARSLVLQHTYLSGYKQGRREWSTGGAPR